MRYFFARLAVDDYAAEFDLLKMTASAALNNHGGLPLDSLSISSTDSARGLKRLDFRGVMQVRRKTGGNSTLALNYDYIDFDAFGNLYPADGVKISGYWGQFRVADMLPFDYWPE